MARVNETHFTRAAYVRGLAQSAVEIMGCGDRATGIRELARVCVHEGSRRGMKVWGGDKSDPVDNGVKSIRRLLKIDKTIGLSPYGKERNVLDGSNNKWVMNLIEVGALRIVHGKEELPKPEPVTVDPVRNGAVLQKLRSLASMKPMSMRLLEAYIAHDDQAIVDISEELERKGL